jgi:hypothetical protein
VGALVEKNENGQLFANQNLAKYTQRMEFACY